MGLVRQRSTPSDSRAAQYLRMSTEQQRYSIESQAAAIAAYAQAQGYAIVQTYADEAISGLLFKERTALRQLLADVVGGQAGFSTVLVYDVSRWGRFQDPDQSAHYEYVCRQAGVAIRYCAEAFEADGDAMDALLKQVKRLMAAEYSRELSIKLRAAGRGLAAKGFRQGGPAGYGLRRQVIDEAGAGHGLLGPGERKAIQSHRVVLVPGPADEVAVVRRIYRLYVNARMSQKAIVALLNSEECLDEFGRPWTVFKLRQVLTNEKYVGTLVYGRLTHPLASKLAKQPVKAWVRVDRAYEPIVGRALFRAAQRQIRGRRLHLGDQEMLARLAKLLARKGALSVRTIRAAKDMPRAETYMKRFGGLRRAYELVGYTNYDSHVLGGFKNGQPRLSDEDMLDALRSLVADKGALSFRLLLDDKTTPSPTAYRNRFGGLREAYRLIGYTEQPCGRKKTRLVSATARS